MVKKIILGALITLLAPISVFALTDDTPTSPESDGVYCPNLVQTMQKGARDFTTTPTGQVSELQAFLTDYYNLPDGLVSGGYFGNTTKRYVIQFQSEQNLPAYGIVGSLTREKISQLCGGSRSSTSLDITSPTPAYGSVDVRLTLSKDLDQHFVVYIINPVSVATPVSSGALLGLPYYITPANGGVFTAHLGLASAHEGFASNQGGVHWFPLPNGKYKITAVVYPSSPFKPGTDMEYLPVGQEPPAVKLIDSQEFTLVNGDISGGKCGVNTFSVGYTCGEGFTSATYQCYDGTTGTLGERTSCKPSEVWKQYADAACKSRCNIPSSTPWIKVREATRPSLTYAHGGLPVGALGVYLVSASTGDLVASAPVSNGDGIGSIAIPVTVPGGRYYLKIAAFAKEQVIAKSDEFSLPAASASNGAVRLSVDPSSPSLQIVPSGSAGITTSIFKLRATGEDVKIQKLQLLISTDTAIPSDIDTFSVYSGSQKIGEGMFVGSSNTATLALSQPLTLLRDADTSITVKANIARIGTGYTGRSGDLIKLLVMGAEGVGLTSGLNISVNQLDASPGEIAGVRIFKSVPTFGQIPVGPSSSSLVNGTQQLLKFSVTANPAGSVGMKEWFINMGSSNAQVGMVTLYAFSDSAFMAPVPGFSSGALASGNLNGQPGADLHLALQGNSVLEIPAGATYYFAAVGAVSGVTSSQSVVRTTLIGDQSWNGIGTYAAQQGYGVVWTPNSFTTSSPTDNDWTNGFGLQGLPVSGLTQLLTGNGGGTGCTAPRITQPQQGYSIAMSPGQNGSGQIFTADQSVTYTLANTSPAWASFSGSTLTFNNVPSGVGTYTFTVVATNSCGSIAQFALPVIVTNGTAAIDQSSLSFTSDIRTITGTARDVGAVGLVISNSAGKVYGSGQIGNQGGRWTHTITTGLAPGTYQVAVYNYFSNVQLTTGTLTIATPATPSASIDASSLYSNGYPTLTGTATNVSSVRVTVSAMHYNGQSAFDGSVSVSGGRWSVSFAVPYIDAFLVRVYAPDGTLLTSGTLTVYVDTSGEGGGASASDPNANLAAVLPAYESLVAVLRKMVEQLTR